jgi:hypothetical protein
MRLVWNLMNITATHRLRTEPVHYARVMCVHAIRGRCGSPARVSISS